MLRHWALYHLARRRTRRSVLRAARRAFTLVEMLVAMALTLILVYAIAEFYAYVGDIVRDGRAMIEMGGELRAASNRLKEDLNSLTVQVRPWADDGAAPGYFEYFEGGFKDSDVDGDGIVNQNSEDKNNNGVLDNGEDSDGDGSLDIGTDANTNSKNDFDEFNATTMMGDGDDVLAFTIRSNGEPFTGRFNGTMIVSNLAEVIWWVGFNDTNGDSGWDIDEPRFLFRRVLLIRPALNNPMSGILTGVGTYTAADFPSFFNNNDISAHFTISGVVANSLTNLCRRENRFAHNPGLFPHILQTTQLSLMSPNASVGATQLYSMQGASKGEDIIMSNLLAFDVRLYDPDAPIRYDGSTVAQSNTALIPGDPGFAGVAAANLLGNGAYVDLWYNRASDTNYSPTQTGRTSFSGPPAPSRADQSSSILGATYDTWSISYERDGTNQNGGTLTDEGVNGIDDNGTNGVDDVGERETSPPYPYPLRGIQVRIRLYEPSTRQTRQATVVADFLPE